MTKFNWDLKTKFRVFSLTAADKASIQIHSLQVLYQNNNKFIEDYLKKETEGKVEEINRIINDFTNVPDDEIKELLQPINDYYGLSHETKDLLSNYMIVASFSLYEKAIKRIMELTGRFSPAQLRSCYKKDSVVKLLKDEFSIDYNTLMDVDIIEELRCLNNDIKHSDTGTVTPPLAATNAKWVVDEPILNTYDDFVRLMEGPRNFLRDLASKIEPKL